jgi:hypothetical protein
MNINDYLQRQYPAPGCWALVADVYASELHADVLGFTTINNSVRAIASAFRIALHKSEHGFVQTPAPTDFSVVLLGKSRALGLHHCGVYYQGSVLHVLPNITLFEPIQSIEGQYELVEFWSKPGGARA